MELLERIGYDSIKLWHEDPQQPDELWVDFAEFGSFERFINNEIQTTEE
ncbi:Cys Met metabolism pyridoxal-phosphate-dependent protein [Latilactobacillus curvatus]|nr:Cys Met metabolism pyridoxal-phosphate-dependent protein [Latilactobacillus curvatus]